MAASISKGDYKRVSSRDGVPMRNIYFMMCYAWDCRHLLDSCPASDDEEFDNVVELLTFLLVRESAQLVKRGFKRGYVKREEPLSVPRGHINMKQSFFLKAQSRVQLDCTYSEYSSDIALNRVIAYSLRHCVSKRLETKRLLAQTLPFFQGISGMEPTKEVLSSLAFDRSNEHYRLIVHLCRFLYEHVLPSEKQGRNRFETAERGRYLAAIFEGFIREYYREYLSGIHEASYWVGPGNKQVRWALEGTAPNLLPAMYSDVWIEKNKGKEEAELFIIDAKFYQHTLTDRTTFHSHNLYQIQSYMLNALLNGRTTFNRVHGCLLYPKVNRAVNQDIPHQIGTISIRTVDLSMPWRQILSQMQDIWWSLDANLKD